MGKAFPYTQLTLKLLRGAGYSCGIVERWIQRAFKRVDLFGIIDIVCMGSGHILGVQSTSYGKRSEHVKTLLVDQKHSSEQWVSNGGALWLVTWKKELRGKVAFRYIAHVEEVVKGENGLELRLITVNGERHGQDDGLEEL